MVRAAAERLYKSQLKTLHPAGKYIEINMYNEQLYPGSNENARRKRDFKSLRKENTGAIQHLRSEHTAARRALVYPGESTCSMWRAAKKRWRTQCSAQHRGMHGLGDDAIGGATLHDARAQPGDLVVKRHLEAGRGLHRKLVPKDARV
jgi:hypothetical protein